MREVHEVVPGLWRWTARHSAWVPNAEPDSPDDWGEFVGCVLYELPDAVVFIDPLVPADRESFWQWADQRVVGRRVVALTTLAPHRRSREEVTWLYWVRVDQEGLRSLLEPLLELPIERVLVSHGEPVLSDGGGALRRCLSKSD